MYKFVKLCFLLFSFFSNNVFHYVLAMPTLFESKCTTNKARYALEAGKVFSPWFLHLLEKSQSMAKAAATNMMNIVKYASIFTSFQKTTEFSKLKKTTSKDHQYYSGQINSSANIFNGSIHFKHCIADHWSLTNFKSFEHVWSKTFSFFVILKMHCRSRLYYIKS